MTSVLETNYIEPKRPYSQDELQDMRKNLFNNMRLGKTLAHHTHCGHFYFVKQNGRKEKDIIDTGDSNCGNCSVCWKITKTPHHLRNNARQLVNLYTNEFSPNLPPKSISYVNIDLEVSFYKWLYEDFN